MGATFPDGVIWPEEKTSWTAAAVLLAYDALRNITPAGRLFSHNFWEGNARLTAGKGMDPAFDSDQRKSALDGSGG
jgi:hypothetical protein